MQAEGYVFVELYVVNLDALRRIFRDALGFRVVEDEEDFVKLAADHATVLLNAMTDLPPAHPFAAIRSGPRAA